MKMHPLEILKSNANGVECRILSSEEAEQSRSRFIGVSGGQVGETVVLPRGGMKFIPGYCSIKDVVQAHNRLSAFFLHRERSHAKGIPEAEIIEEMRQSQMSFVLDNESKGYAFRDISVFCKDKDIEKDIDVTFVLSSNHEWYPPISSKDLNDIGIRKSNISWVERDGFCYHDFNPSGVSSPFDLEIVQAYIVENMLLLGDERKKEFGKSNPVYVSKILELHVNTAPEVSSPSSSGPSI